MPPLPDPSKTYYIQNHYLDAYLAVNKFGLIVERNKVVSGGDKNEWRFVPVHSHGGTPAGYYIQNVANSHFLTMKYTKASDGLEDLLLGSNPQFFKIEPRGAYWIIYIDDNTTQHQKYYLNCYINGFDFCNSHAHAIYKGCKEASRREWAFEPTT